MTQRLCLAAVAALLCAGSASAACLNPFGCEPRTLDECRTDASKRPTERGVTVALQDCHRKFVVEPAEASRRKIEAEQLKAWSALRSRQLSATELRKALGRAPDMVSLPGECTRFEGTPPPNTGCILQRWRFGSDGSAAAPGDPLGLARYLQAEVSGPDGVVWAFVEQPTAPNQLAWR